MYTGTVQYNKCLELPLPYYFFKTKWKPTIQIFPEQNLFTIIDIFLLKLDSVQSFSFMQFEGNAQEKWAIGAACVFASKFPDFREVKWILKNQF